MCFCLLAISLGHKEGGDKIVPYFFSFLVEVLDSVQGAASLTARSRPAPQPAGEDHTSLKNLGYWTVGTSPRLPLGDELACFCGEITARARCAASCAVPRSSRIRTARSPGGSTAGCWELRRKRPPQNKVSEQFSIHTHTRNSPSGAGLLVTCGGAGCVAAATGPVRPGRPAAQPAVRWQKNETCPLAQEETKRSLPIYCVSSRQLRRFVHSALPHDPLAAQTRPTLDKMSERCLRIPARPKTT